MAKTWNFGGVDCAEREWRVQRAMSSRDARRIRREAVGRGIIVLAWVGIVGRGTRSSFQLRKV